MAPKTTVTTVTVTLEIFEKVEKIYKCLHISEIIRNFVP